MEAANHRYCEDCLVPLTIEHLLIECPNYINERRTCFGKATLGLSEVFSRGASGSMVPYAGMLEQ